MNDEIFWKYPDAIVSCEWLNKNLNNPDSVDTCQIALWL